MRSTFAASPRVLKCVLARRLWHSKDRTTLGTLSLLADSIVIYFHFLDAFEAVEFNHRVASGF